MLINIADILLNGSSPPIATSSSPTEMPSRLKQFVSKFSLGRFERDKAERWYSWYGKAILTGYRNEHPPEPKYERAPTFKEFVRYLVELPLDKFDAHWKPMYLQCMPCHIQYRCRQSEVHLGIKALTSHLIRLRVIARLDSFTVDSAYILKAIGVPGRLGVSHTTQGNKTENTVASFFSTLDRALLDQLYQIYRPDFLLFNYTMDHYRDYVQSEMRS